MKFPGVVFIFLKNNLNQNKTTPAFISFNNGKIWREVRFLKKDTLNPCFEVKTKYIEKM